MSVSFEDALLRRGGAFAQSGLGIRGSPRGVAVFGHVLPRRPWRRGRGKRSPWGKETPMPFVISGLSPEPFRPLFALPDEALAERRIVRRTVDAPVGFPCRVTLQDAVPGETVLLMNYEHQ